MRGFHREQAQTLMPPGAPASLWRSGLHTLAVSLASVVIGFGQSILIARVLGDPATKGGYDLTLATASLISLVLGLSLPVGATYVVARRRANAGALAKWLLAWAALQGLVALVVFLLIHDSAFGGALLPRTLGVWAIAPLVILVAGTSAVASLRNVLFGEQRIVVANNGDLMGRAIVPLAMIAVAVASVKLGPRYLPLAFLWCSALGMMVTSSRFLALLRNDLRSNSGAAGLREVLSFAIPAHVGNVVQFLNYRLDLFLVSALIGLRAVGIYALAVSVAQLLWLISQSAATVLLPRVASEADTTPAAAAERSAQVARLTLWVTASAALFLALFGQFLIPVVYGEKFRDSLQPFLLLLPGISGFSLAIVLAAHIAGAGRPSINVVVAAVALVVTLILDLTLIPAIGVPGAAIASSASYLTTALVTAGVFSWMTHVSPVRLVVPNAADLAVARRFAASLRRRATGS